MAILVCVTISGVIIQVAFCHLVSPSGDMEWQNTLNGKLFAVRCPCDVVSGIIFQIMYFSLSHQL